MLTTFRLASFCRLNVNLKIGIFRYGFTNGFNGSVLQISFQEKKIIMFLVILRFILTHFIVRGSYSYLESKTSTQDNFYLIYQIQIASKLIYK